MLGTNILHECSSEPSLHSVLPLHLKSMLTHWPSPQVNSKSVQDEIVTNLILWSWSGQNWKQQKCEKAMINEFVCWIWIWIHLWIIIYCPRMCTKKSVTFRVGKKIVVILICCYPLGSWFIKPNKQWSRKMLILNKQMIENKTFFTKPWA